jgi:hypothetical protein
MIVGTKEMDGVREFISSPQEIADGIKKYKEETKKRDELTRMVERFQEAKEYEKYKKLQEIRSKKPLVINLFGVPGAGKSTGAAIVFAELKKRGVNAELVTEYAKDKTWEGNATALGCQEYVFGKQSYRLARCRADVDVIVTDSPLPLSLLYVSDPALLSGGAFQQVVMNVFNSYNNLNFYILRAKPYNPKGRNQTEEESNALHMPLQTLLAENKIPHCCVYGDDEGYAAIVERVVEWLGL